MGMTLTQKILARHCGQESLTPGQLIEADVDLILGNDLTTPIAVHEMERVEGGSVSDPDKVVIVMDHFTPNKDIACAGQCVICREFAKKNHISNIFDTGKGGIEHVLLPERGMISPGMLTVGADSHTCTYGALGAFATGIGSTDMAAAMLTGRLWFQVPEAIKVVLTGRPGQWVSGKDIILRLLSETGSDGASYASLEFTGSGTEHLTMDDRLTICNMAVEAGAKNGIFAADSITDKFLEECGAGDGIAEHADADAEYRETIELRLDEMVPMVSVPYSPDRAVAIDDAERVQLDQVVIGSCTNGRLSDLKTAAEIMKGRKVADGLRVIVIPATQKIYLDAMRAGYIETFIEAGCAVTTPCCGPCIGGSAGVLAAGETALATTNRNFRGRMGHVDSKVYLSNPAVAAASALTGRISAPWEVL